MSDIFISYSAEDRSRAQVIAQLLEGQGWSIFWDRTIPIGRTWRDVIRKELDEARCVIVLWSKISIGSGWVQDEADDAKRRRVLVPVLIEDVLPPIGFRSIQAADLTNWDGTEATPSVRTLVQGITGIIGPPAKEAEEERERTEAEAQLKAVKGSVAPEFITAGGSNPLVATKRMIFAGVAGVERNLVIIAALTSVTTIIVLLSLTAVALRYINYPF
jgi:TIR domain